MESHLGKQHHAAVVEAGSLSLWDDTDTGGGGLVLFLAPLLLVQFPGSAEFDFLPAARPPCGEGGPRPSSSFSFFYFFLFHHLIK